MPLSLALRHLRHLSTTVTTTKPTTISASMAKYKLRTEHDPEKALEIYKTSLSSSSNNKTNSPLSSRYAQDLTVKRLAKAKRFDDIENLLEGHKKDDKIIQEPFLSTLIRSYGTAGMFDHALRTYDQMEELENLLESRKKDEKIIQGPFLSMLIRSYAIAGMFDHELRTYDQMEELGTPRSTLSFNALLSSATLSRRFDKVPQLFNEMPERFGFSPDKFSYGILVKAYCGCGKVDMAIETVTEMEKKGIEVTGVVYTTLLSGLLKMGKVIEAEKVWEEMVSKGLSIDVAAYNVRLMGIGNIEDVKGVIEEMKGKELIPDTISYNYLMTCYCKYGMMKEARRVYEGLEGNGCKANAATFRTLVFHYCRYGDFDKGYEVFKESVAVNKIPDFNTLQHLVRGLVGKSKMKDAKGMCRTVKKKFPATFMNSWRKLEEELGLFVSPSSAPQEIQ